MKKRNVIIIIILMLVILGLSCYILYNKNNNAEEIANYKEQIASLQKQIKNSNKEIKNSQLDKKTNLEDLYGKYKWEKSYILENPLGSSEQKYNVQLILNNDGSATYSASSGLETEKTKGIYEYKDDKIIYTRKYYNYDDEKVQYTENSNSIVTFIVVDKNTLKSNYYNQKIILKKEN